MNIRESFDIYFELVKDFRSQSHVTYKLSDILFVLVSSILCSCTDLEMIIEFAEEKIDFIKKYTEMDKDCEYEIFRTIEKNHGRIEKRTCYVC